MNNQSTDQHWQVLVLLLKNIAAEKGITREQISDKTGMKASSISRIFSLRYRVTLANYVSIAQAIGVNLFIDDKDSKSVEDAEEAMRTLKKQWTLDGVERSAYYQVYINGQWEANCDTYEEAETIANSKAFEGTINIEKRTT